MRLVRLTNAIQSYPMLGIAPPVIWGTRFSADGPHWISGYSDLFQIYPYQPAMDQSGGMVKYKQDNTAPDIPDTAMEYLQVKRYAWDWGATAEPWRMKRHMQPGLARRWTISCIPGTTGAHVRRCRRTWVDGECGDVTP